MVSHLEPRGKEEYICFNKQVKTIKITILQQDLKMKKQSRWRSPDGLALAYPGLLSGLQRQNGAGGGGVKLQPWGGWQEQVHRAVVCQ